MHVFSVSFLLETGFSGGYFEFPPMTFRILSPGVGLRFGLAMVAASALMSCTSSSSRSASQGLDPDVFALSDQARRSRFPQSQRIGVVELSGRRVQERAFKGSADEKEYLATGGAFLVKRLDRPVYASGDQILVTPEAATIRGPRAMVQQADGRIWVADTVDSQIIIDGTQIRAEGPHRIETAASLKASLAAPAPAPVVAPAAQAPAPVVAVKKEVEKTAPVAPAPAPKPAPAKVAVAAPKLQAQAALPKSVNAAPAKPKSKPKPAATATAARAPSASKPAAAAPAPKVDRKELLNLMRDPTE